jgi:uncharacterized coiled-coil protein SlyX
MTEPRPDFEQVRAQFDRICDIEDPSVQSHAAAISYSIVVPALLAAIDELEAKVAEQDHIIRNSGRIKHVLELEAMRDRVLALHQKVRSQSLCGPGDFCVEDGRSWPCETVRALEP